jgi:hypothetical protein
MSATREERIRAAVMAGRACLEQGDASEVIEALLVLFKKTEQLRLADGETRVTFRVPAAAPTVGSDAVTPKAPRGGTGSRGEGGAPRFLGGPSQSEKKKTKKTTTAEAGV